MHPIKQYIPKEFDNYNKYYRSLEIGNVLSYIEESFIENGIMLQVNTFKEYNTDIDFDYNSKLYVIVFYLQKTIKYTQFLDICDILLNNVSGDYSKNGNWCKGIHFDISVSEDGIDYVNKHNDLNNKITFKVDLEKYLYYIRKRKILDGLKCIQ